jgi:hypothetical protein
MCLRCAPLSPGCGSISMALSVDQTRTETHRMTVLRGADIEAKKKYAQDIAGIREHKKEPSP